MSSECSRVAFSGLPRAVGIPWFILSRISLPLSRVRFFLSKAACTADANTMDPVFANKTGRPHSVFCLVYGEDVFGKPSLARNIAPPVILPPQRQ